jgi:hypothetical protein
MCSYCMNEADLPFHAEFQIETRFSNRKQIELTKSGK